MNSKKEERARLFEEAQKLGKEMLESPSREKLVKYRELMDRFHELDPIRELTDRVRELE